MISLFYSKRLVFLFTACFFSIGIFAQVSNDHCSSAQTITPNNVCGSTVYSTSNSFTGTNACAANTNADDDVWFVFNATCATHDIRIEAESAGFDPVVEVRNLSCNGNTIQCENNFGPDEDESFQISNLTVGANYYVRVYGAGSANVGDFKICINDACNPPPCSTSNPQPVNGMDICANVPNMCNANSICGSTAGYGSGPTPYSANTWNELTAAFCGSIENNSFFSFIASEATLQIRVYGSCTTGNAIQAMVFTLDNPVPPGTCNNGPVTSYGCFSPITLNPSPANGIPISFTGMTPGEKYYVMIDGFAGASCDYQFVIDYGIQPAVYVTPDVDTVCVNSSLMLVADGGASGNYTWESDPALNSTSGDTVMATFSNTGDYSFVVHTTASASNCPSTDTAFINVQSPVQPTVGADFTHCEKSTFSLTSTPTATAGSTYEWSFLAPPSGGNVSFAPNANLPTVDGYAVGDGLFTLIFTEQNAGCGSASDSLEVTIEPAPDLVAPNDTAICGGATLALTAQGAASYNWDNGQSSQATYVVYPTSDTVFYVTGYLGNCSLTDSVVVTVGSQLPVLSFISDTICAGDSAHFSVSGANDYQWSHNQSTQSAQTEAPTANTTYYVIGTTDGCSTVDSVEIVVNALPMVVLNDFDPSTVCIQDGQVPLPAATPIGGYYAGPGVGSSHFDPAQADTGIHAIYYGYIDTNGCPGFDSTQITVQESCLSLTETSTETTVLTYPNPTSKELTVEIHENREWMLSVIDMKGREVYGSRVGQGKLVINVENWAKGTYRLMLTTDAITSFQTNVIVE